MQYNILSMANISRIKLNVPMLFLFVNINIENKPQFFSIISTLLNYENTHVNVKIVTYGQNQCCEY